MRVMQQFIMLIVIGFLLSQPAMGQKKSAQDGRDDTNAELSADDLALKKINEDLNESLSSEEREQRLQLELMKSPPKTAAELIDRIDNSLSYWSASPQLSDSEMEKAIKLLRDRYPFESLRVRLPQHANQQPDIETKAIPNPKLDKEALAKHKFKTSRFSPRVSALAQLHSDEVRDFIQRDNNGFLRSIPVTPYSLKANQYAQSFQSRDVDSAILGESIVSLKKLNKKENAVYATRMKLSESGMPNRQIVEKFHRTAFYGFANPNTFGIFKNIDNVAGFKAHQVQIQSGWSGDLYINKNSFATEPEIEYEFNWTTNRLQLVSLLLHDTPQVYVTDDLPDMERLSGADVETRTLSEFESGALEKLRGGETEVIRATPNRIIMLGAISANESCVECHTDKAKGDLLGAFSYEFLRDPQVDVGQQRF